MAAEADVSVADLAVGERYGHSWVSTGNNLALAATAGTVTTAPTFRQRMPKLGLVEVGDLGIIGEE